MMIATITYMMLAFGQAAPDQPVNASAPPATYVGKAFDLKSGAPVYTEVHTEIREGEKRVGVDTDYKDVDGKVIVRRTVSFRKHPTLAEFRTEDLRTGAIEGAEYLGEEVRLYYRDAGEELYNEKRLDIPNPGAIDAGFNNFVQMNWDALRAGKKLYFNFAVPFRLDYFGFRVYQEDVVEKDGRTLVQVICDIDNFVLRLFLKPIVLTYDADARRLVSYEGISNIAGTEGTNYFVRIEYDPYGP